MYLRDFKNRKLIGTNTIHNSFCLIAAVRSVKIGIFLLQTMKKNSDCELKLKE